MTAVATLAGADLALWVAKAEGMCLHTAGERKECGNWGTDYYCLACGKDICEGPDINSWNPHRNWTQAGPLIEKHKIATGEGSNQITFPGWHAKAGQVNVYNRDQNLQFGPTPLIAAMRALVWSVYGDNVPDEVTP